MIIIGIKDSVIGIFLIENIKCNECESKTNHEIIVFGRYLHLYFVPFVPFGKRVFAECQNCNKVIKKKEFSDDLEQEYNYYQGENVQRPFWHRIGLIIFILLIGVIVYVASETEPDSRSNLLNQEVESKIENPTHSD